MNVTHRLGEFIEEKKLSIHAFELKVGVTKNVLQKAIRSNTSFSMTALEKIATTFPELNMNWLIGGSGEMFMQASGIIMNEPGNAYKNPNATEKIVMELQQKLIACYEENTRLKESSTVNRHTAAR